jgi:hypothetical protein
MARTGTAIALGTLLLLPDMGTAGAQATATMRIPSKYAQPAKTGVLRQLVCRGRAGLHLTPRPDSSSTREAAVTLAYRRNPRPSGDNYQELEPGTCSWNPGGDASLPPEPGRVHFSLAREGSAWVPDPKTLTIWLNDPQHYWVFFVDDVTHTAISHGAFRDRFWAGDAPKSASRSSEAAGVLRAVELRCRGGSGLGFSRGADAGHNLVAVTLTYAVSPNPPGETGGGLSAGTCAWADRAGVRSEPGRIMFTTAGNAQLKQAQSGTEVDRSPSAAERWPDAHTIPVYLSDPGRFWTFSVVAADPDSARTHGPWKPTSTDAIAGSLADASPVRTVPESPLAGKRTPGAGDDRLSYDAEAIHAIKVTPGVTSVEMRFKGPARQPLVQISRSAPFREPSTGRWIFPPDRQSLRVVGSSGGAPRDYSAVNTTPLTRNTEYHYLINAPEGPGRVLGKRRLPDPEHQAFGTFRTLRTTVKVRIIKVHVIDDSDDDSSGELAFTFAVNGGDELEERFEAGTGLAAVSPGSLLDLESGATKWFANAITVSDAPDHLRIQATGFDNDGAFSGGKYDASWTATPGGDGGGDWNHARAEYHLDQYSERAFEFPFKMRTGPGSKLQFEVEGRVSVTRQ